MYTSYPVRSLTELMQASERIYDLAGFRDEEMAIALDRLYKAYTGMSALDAAGVDVAWLREAAKSGQKKGEKGHA